jgi:hypothetical protein
MYQARFQTLDLSQHICSKCGFFRISQGRYELLKKMRETTSPNQRMLCLPCGDAEAHKESKRKASMVQIPYSKGAYQYIHNPADLRTTNPKRTT